MKLFQRTDTDNKIERDQKEILEEDLGRDCGKIGEKFRTDHHQVRHGHHLHQGDDNRLNISKELMTRSTTNMATILSRR